MRLEILAPKDESIIYVKENRYIEPFEFKIRITNLGNDTFNLNSNLKVSLERSPIEGPMQARIWDNDDLKLEPNEFFEESGTEFHHLGFSKYSKPSFGEQKLNLHLVEYIEANQSYVRTETTSILLNFVSEQPTELTIIIGVIVAGEIGVISYWALKKIISKKKEKGNKKRRTACAAQIKNQPTFLHASEEIPKERMLQTPFTHEALITTHA